MCVWGVFNYKSDRHCASLVCVRVVPVCVAVLLGSASRPT